MSEVQGISPRPALGPINLLQKGSACVLMIRADYATSAAGVEWCLVGRKPHQRRWVFINDVSTDLNVMDGERRIAWQAVVTSPPLWAGDVRVDFDADHSTLRLQDRISFRFTAGPSVSIEYACCNGSPLKFLDAARTRTEQKRVTPERAASGFHLHIGLERLGERTIFRKNVFVPVRGLTVEQNGEWKSLPSDRWISTSQARIDAFRLFTDGPNLLMEGNTVHRRLGNRPHPLGRLLGTGSPIRLVDVPYNPSQDMPLAAHAIDFGFVVDFQSDGADARLALQWAKPPSADHQLVLWSNRHGLCRIDYDRIAWENDGRVWRFELPWTDPPEAATMWGGLQGGPSWLWLVGTMAPFLLRQSGRTSRAKDPSAVGPYSLVPLARPSGEQVRLWPTDVISIGNSSRRRPTRSGPLRPRA